MGARQAKNLQRHAKRGNEKWIPAEQFRRRIGISEQALQRLITKRLITKGSVIVRGGRVRWR